MNKIIMLPLASLFAMTTQVMAAEETAAPAEAVATEAAPVQVAAPAAVP